MNCIKGDRSRNNSHGFSVVEMLIAASILSVSALGLGYSIHHLGKSRERTQMASQAVALESSFVASMADPANYTQATLDQMRNGAQVDHIALNVRVPQATSNGIEERQVSVESDRVSYFTADLAPCAAASLTDPSCAFSIRIAIRRVDVASGASDTVRYSYAYRIDFNEKIGFASLGSGTGQTFTPEDYRLPIPNDVYRPDQMVPCNGDSLLVRGINPTTGQVVCLTKSNDGCPAGTIPLGLEVVNNVVQMRCSRVTSVVSCPANYALQSVDFDSLVVTGAVPQYSCIYSGRDSQMYPNSTTPRTYSGGTISGTPCPPKYYLSPTSRCQMRVTRNTPGTCYSPNLTVDPPARNAIGQWYTREDTTYTGYQVPAVPGRMQERYEGGTFNCAIEIPEQPCGAQWDAVATLQVECLMYRGDGDYIAPTPITVTTLPARTTTTTLPPVEETTTTLPGTTTTTTTTTTTLPPTTTTTTTLPPTTTAPPPPPTTTTAPPPTTTTRPPGGGGGGGGGGCFVAGTQISMADGSTKNIEDIRSGDQIVAWDEYAKAKYITSVRAPVFHKAAAQVIFEFELEDGTVLTSNDVHPIWIQEYGTYLQARRAFAAWRSGASVSMMNQEMQSVKIVNVRMSEQFVPVYNMQVEGITYYNEDTGMLGYGFTYFANGVLVHNVMKQ